MDALLWLSFGGPEKPDDVRPFLENVTRGRGVPPERLDEVEQHYLGFGGVSPINALNRAAIEAVEAELAAQGIDLPVYFGNRNWHPMVEDTLAEMARDGVHSALVFPTSAYGGYSACRQYDEDVIRARSAVGDGAPDLTKLRQFFDHPLFVSAFADAVRAASEGLGEYRLVFTAHSVPVSADAASGPPDSGGHRYSKQIAEAARLVALDLGVPERAAGVWTDEHGGPCDEGARGLRAQEGRRRIEAREAPSGARQFNTEYDVVWQSRSGPPQVPWLEPDILDHLDALHGKGVPAVVLCPVGFVSDHLEVVWDLDTEAAEKAAELGMGFARAAAPSSDPRFAQLVVELVREHLADAPVRKLSDFPAAGCTLNGAPCAVACCEPPQRSRR